MQPRRVAVEYKCERCGKISTLRHPLLVNLGLPLAVALCCFLTLYHFLVAIDSWISLSALLLAGLILGVQWVATIALSRFTRRFDPRHDS
jgi:hypothetical protein